MDSKHNTPEEQEEEEEDPNQWFFTGKTTILTPVVPNLWGGGVIT